MPSDKLPTLPPRPISEADLNQVRIDMLDHYEGDEICMEVNVVANLVNTVTSQNSHIADLEREIREARELIVAYEEKRKGSIFFPDFYKVTQWLERNAERENGS
jgi:hypothetical protein